MSSDLRSLLPREIEFGGELFVMRLLDVGDEERLRSFFHSHTEETIRQRYGYQFAEMSRERSHQLVDVVQTRDLALGIFERSLNDEVLHAIGRYILDADGRNAEVALVVRETRRNLGMATALLRTLLRIARRRDLQTLHAQINRDNYEMLGIFRKFKATLNDIPGAEAVSAVIAL